MERAPDGHLVQKHKTCCTGPVIGVVVGVVVVAAVGLGCWFWDHQGKDGDCTKYTKQEDCEKADSSSSSSKKTDPKGGKTDTVPTTLKCSWNSSTKKCIAAKDITKEDCAKITSETSCKAASDVCEWTETSASGGKTTPTGTCSPNHGQITDCKKVTTKDDCNKLTNGGENDNCYWEVDLKNGASGVPDGAGANNPSAEQLAGYCQNQSTLTALNAETNCRWMDQDTCKSDFPKKFCTWDDSHGCVVGPDVDPCTDATLTTAKLCNDISQCYWAITTTDSTTGKCANTKKITDNPETQCKTFTQTTCQLPHVATLCSWDQTNKCTAKAAQTKTKT